MALVLLLPALNEKNIFRCVSMCLANVLFCRRLSFFAQSPKVIPFWKQSIRVAAAYWLVPGYLLFDLLPFVFFFLELLGGFLVTRIRVKKFSLQHPLVDVCNTEVPCTLSIGTRTVSVTHDTLEPCKIP